MAEENRGKLDYSSSIGSPVPESLKVKLESVRAECSDDFEKINQECDLPATNDRVVHLQDFSDDLSNVSVDDQLPLSAGGSQCDEIAFNGDVNVLSQEKGNNGGSVGESILNLPKASGTSACHGKPECTNTFTPDTDRQLKVSYPENDEAEFFVGSSVDTVQGMPVRKSYIHGITILTLGESHRELAAITANENRSTLKRKVDMEDYHPAILEVPSLNQQLGAPSRKQIELQPQKLKNANCIDLTDSESQGISVIGCEGADQRQGRGKNSAGTTEMDMLRVEGMEMIWDDGTSETLITQNTNQCDQEDAELTQLFHEECEVMFKRANLLPRPEHNVNEQRAGSEQCERRVGGGTVSAGLDSEEPEDQCSEIQQTGSSDIGISNTDSRNDYDQQSGNELNDDPCYWREKLLCSDFNLIYANLRAVLMNTISKDNRSMLIHSMISTMHEIEQITVGSGQPITCPITQQNKDFKVENVHEETGDSHRSKLKFEENDLQFIQLSENVHPGNKFFTRHKRKSALLVKRYLELINENPDGTLSCRVCSLQVKLHRSAAVVGKFHQRLTIPFCRACSVFCSRFERRFQSFTVPTCRHTHLSIGIGCQICRYRRLNFLSSSDENRRIFVVHVIPHA